MGLGKKKQKNKASELGAKARCCPTWRLGPRGSSTLVMGEPTSRNTQACPPLASVHTSQKSLHHFRGFFGLGFFFFFPFGCYSSSGILSHNSTHMLEIFFTSSWKSALATREKASEASRKPPACRPAEAGAHAAGWGPCSSPAALCKVEEQRAQRAPPIQPPRAGSWKRRQK